MPVNRKLFTQAFTRTRVPNWRCPRYDGGHLSYDPQLSLQFGPTLVRKYG